MKRNCLLGSLVAALFSFHVNAAIDSSSVGVALENIPANTIIEAAFIDRNLNGVEDPGELLEINNGVQLFWQPSDSELSCDRVSPIVVTWHNTSTSVTDSITLVPVLAPLVRGEWVSYAVDVPSLLWTSMSHILSVGSDCLSRQSQLTSMQTLLTLLDESVQAVEQQSIYSRHDWWPSLWGASGALSTEAVLFQLQGIGQGAKETYLSRNTLSEGESIIISYTSYAMRGVDDNFPQDKWWKVIKTELNNLGSVGTSVVGEYGTSTTLIIASEDFSIDERVHYARDELNRYSAEFKISIGREFQGAFGHTSGYLDGAPMVCSTREYVETWQLADNIQFINIWFVDNASGLNSCDTASASTNLRRQVMFKHAQFEFAANIPGFPHLDTYLGFATDTSMLSKDELAAFAKALPGDFCESGLGGANQVFRRRELLEGGVKVTQYRQDSWQVDERREYSDGSVSQKSIAAEDNVLFSGCDLRLFDSDKDGVTDDRDAFVSDPNEQFDSDFDGLGNNVELATGLDPNNPDMDADGYADGFDFAPENSSIAFGGDTAALDLQPIKVKVRHWQDWAVLPQVDVVAKNASAKVVSVMRTNADGEVLLKQPGETTLKLALQQPDNVIDENRPITSADALAALKIAVGLNPNTEGEISPYQMIAADFNRDGKVTSADALAILKAAVGLGNPQHVDWRYIDGNTDLRHVTRTNVPTQAALNVQQPAGKALFLVAILAGDVNGSIANRFERPGLPDYDPDNDGIVNALDPDDDNDGVLDSVDENPLGVEYFAINPTTITIPEALWASSEGSYTQFVDGVDLNGDGLEDLLIHETFWVPFDADPATPSYDSLIAFVQDTGGTYREANEEIFGSAEVRFEYVSRKRVLADFNKDGFMDVAYALNREDGRSFNFISEPTTQREYSTLQAWAAKQMVVMSNGDGTYRVDTLSGDPLWQHGIGVVYMEDGSVDLIYGDYTGEPYANVYKYADRQWLSMTSYPSLSGWDLRGGLQQPLNGQNYSRYFMSTHNYSDGTHGYSGVQIYEQNLNSWTLFDEYFIGESAGLVEIITDQNGNLSDQYMFTYKGNNYLSFIASESCALQLTPNEMIFITMMDSQLVPADAVAPFDVTKLPSGGQIFVPLAMRNGQVEELDILNEQVYDLQDVYFGCEDINDDGLGDLAIYQDIAVTLAGGPKPMHLFLNNGAGDLVKTPIKGLSDVLDNTKSRRQYADLNGDGIGDIIQMGHREFTIHWGVVPQ